MSSDINNVVISGIVSRNPDIRSTSSGKIVIKFSIENNVEFYNGKTYKTYVNVVKWANSGDDPACNIKQEDRVVVSGSIDTESWDDKETGKKQYRTIIKANAIISPESTQQHHGSSNRYGNEYRPDAASNMQPPKGGKPTVPAMNIEHGAEDDDENDIPF